jgi:rhodanese-related sulfurtransferase
MQSITVQQLKNKMDAGEDLQLVDVREPEEHSEFNIGGQLIPLSAITQQQAALRLDKPVIVYCRKGIRSQIAIQRLMDKYPFTNLYNLTGGMEAWKKAFAPIP